MQELKEVWIVFKQADEVFLVIISPKSIYVDFPRFNEFLPHPQKLFGLENINVAEASEDSTDLIIDLFEHYSTDLGLLD